MSNDEAVWVITNAKVTLNSGATITLGQVNVYPSGLLIDPRTRTAISPAGYVTVQPAG